MAFLLLTAIGGLLNNAMDERQRPTRQHPNREDADAFPAISVLIFPSPTRRQRGGKGNDIRGTPRRRAKRDTQISGKRTGCPVNFMAPGGHGSLLRTRGNMAQRSDEVSSNDNTSLSNADKGPRNRKKGMSDVFVAQGLLRDAFPAQRYGKVEAAFYEAHRYISRRVRKDFTMRRVRSIWEGKARRIDSEEMDALREALIEEQKREQRELRARLAALDETIAAFDAVTARQKMASHRPSADRMG